VMRRAFADRAEYLGDPQFNPDIPLEKLLSKTHATDIKQSITMDKASASDSTKFGRLYESGSNTTHFSVVDAEGNAVALTYTLETGYGSKVVADGLGFFLNNEMGDFNPVPGITNKTGQIGTTPNLIAPGKRMLSSMSPTIIFKDGKLVLVTGAQGGRTIITSVLNVILNYIDHKMNVAQAVEAPRIHHQWLPDRIQFEARSLAPEVMAKLKEKGHRLMEMPGLFPGDANTIIINLTTGERMGGADSRAPDGGAAGY
jgi:gamma-glutamyltranspeptidase / glutathione hydrolase